MGGEERKGRNEEKGGMKRRKEREKGGEDRRKKGTSVSLFRFQRSSRPKPLTDANTEGWIGDHCAS